jgi:hypothetical protein
MRWQSVYASRNSLRKSLFDSRQAITFGKRQFTRILNSARPHAAHRGKYTSNAMDQMELKEEEEGDDRGPFFLHPPYRRWNTFHGDTSELVLVRYL